MKKFKSMLEMDVLRNFSQKGLMIVLVGDFGCFGVKKTPSQGLIAAYASSVSFGHPEHCCSTVWTPKSLGQNLLMMTFLRR